MPARSVGNGRKNEKTGQRWKPNGNQMGRGDAMAQYVLTGGILLICTYTDLRQRKIYRNIVVLHLVLAIFFHLGMKELFTFRIVAGVLPGLVGLALAVVTSQALGYGDAALILSCGLSLGLDQELPILLIAFSGAGMWALFLLGFRHGKKDSEIPFAPFLLAGTVIQGLGELLL